MRHSRILGTGSCVPPRVISNDEVSQWVRLDPEAIFRRTGIRTRCWATEDQTPSILAEEAAHQALKAAGLPASAIDAVLVSTTSPDTVIPSTACHLVRRLGVKSSASFDLAASCSGFLYGLFLADSMIQCGLSHRCLVVAAEVKSRFLDLKDESTAILFADGAGAVVLVGEEAREPVRSGLLGVRVYADGSRHDLISLPAGGSRQPATPQTVLDQLHCIRLNGGPLFRVAVKRLATAVQDILKEFGLDMGDINQTVFHQANGRLLAALQKRLQIPPQKLYSVIERFGNASSASLPIALDHAVREGRIVPGDLVLLGAFGGGLTWATALLRW